MLAGTVKRDDICINANMNIQIRNNNVLKIKMRKSKNYQETESSAWKQNIMGEEINDWYLIRLIFSPGSDCSVKTFTSGVVSPGWGLYIVLIRFSSCRSESDDKYQMLFIDLCYFHALLHDGFLHHITKHRPDVISLLFVVHRREVFPSWLSLVFSCILFSSCASSCVTTSNPFIFFPPL